jgi:hypothetical protein
LAEWIVVSRTPRARHERAARRRVPLVGQTAHRARSLRRRDQAVDPW